MSKIRVGFFADDLGRQAMGTSLVLRRLIAALHNNHSTELDLVLIHKSDVAPSVEFKAIPEVIIPKPNLRKFSGFFSYLWFFIVTPERFDIAHFPRPALHPFFWLLKFFGKTKQIIVTFHGAPDHKEIPIFETLFTKFNRLMISYWGKFWINLAIADSEIAREQIIRYYKLNRKKTAVVYAGVDKACRPLNGEEKSEAQKKMQEEYGITSPYILCVSRLDPHKNVHRTIEAFAKAKRENNLPHQLVIVGAKHEPVYSALVLETIKRLQAGAFVKIIPFVEEGDLPRVYAAADLFIFVSLSEGFGLPLVEAMASGVPTITSNLSCLPEIAGGAAELVDPYSITDIAETIKKLASVKKEVRDKMIRQGIARAEFFRWEKTGRETSNLYNKSLKT